MSLAVLINIVENPLGISEEELAEDIKHVLLDYLNGQSLKVEIDTLKGFLMKKED